MNENAITIALFLAAAFLPSIPILISAMLGKEKNKTGAAHVRTAADVFRESDDDYAKHAFQPHREHEYLDLPAPSGKLNLSKVSLFYDRSAAISSLSFSLSPGDVLGVIGPSGSGKTTLCRLIAGSLLPSEGEVRLSGARIDQYPVSQRRRFIGYLPDIPTFAEASVAENIASFEHPIDPNEIVSSAIRAGAHEGILRLKNGYDTILIDREVPAGLRQLIGFARALYGSPHIVVLDEPNSFQDNSGNEAIRSAVKEAKSAGSIVVIASHRPAPISECNLLLILENGLRRAFGPKDDVLKNLVKSPTPASRDIREIGSS